MLKRLRAQYERLQIELNLTRRGLLVSRELLLVEAADSTALKRTYRRYFQTAAELAEDWISPNHHPFSHRRNI